MNHGRRERDCFHCGGKSLGGNNPSRLRDACIYRGRLFEIEVSKCNMVHFMNTVKVAAMAKVNAMERGEEEDTNHLIFVYVKLYNL